MLNPRSTIGILGGGQLARMLSMAASKLGFRTHVYDPNPDSPAFEVASESTLGAFTDNQLLKEFAKKIDVLTYEFENVPNSTLKRLENVVQIWPDTKALAISQDRVKEKRFFSSLGLKTATYEAINSIQDFSKAISNIPTPAILKTRREGYDGKGQLLISTKTKKSQIEQHLVLGPCILESFVKFTKELSVIIARDQSSNVVSFDPGENIHKSGILHTTTVPAHISKNLKIEAIINAGKIINSLNYVGVLGVEFFLTNTNELILNEIAPRVHNSGHWTQNGCVIDQFEQHIRAISGLPLGNGERHSNVKMVNILGSDIKKSLYISDAAVHMYGKEKVKVGRKMGHVNYVSRIKPQ